MRLQRNLLLAVVAALIGLIVPVVASAAPPADQPGNPELLATLPGGAGAGSTVGPGGALYVTQPASGEIWRIDRKSGSETLYASGLPRRFSQLPFGGVMDVAFIGSTAYALVSARRIRVSGGPVRLSPANRRDLPRGRAHELDPCCGHRHVRVRKPADRLPVRGADGCSVRSRVVPRRIPGHRRAPQPRSPRIPRRNDLGAHRVR